MYTCLGAILIFGSQIFQLVAEISEQQIHLHATKIKMVHISHIGSYILYLIHLPSHFILHIAYYILHFVYYILNVASLILHLPHCILHNSSSTLHLNFASYALHESVTPLTSKVSNIASTFESNIASNVVSNITRNFVSKVASNI